MQICSNCQSKQFDGTIFCSECGENLVAPTRQENTMSLGQRGLTDNLADQAVLIPAPAQAPSEPRITLVVMNSGRRISLEMGDDLLIGRKDNARGIFPDIDLGLEGGYDAGVSRRHAILAYADNGYTVEDLGSANGTFINGQRLTPDQGRRLKHGDELKCGTLLMRVEFS